MAPPPTRFNASALSVTAASDRSPRACCCTPLPLYAPRPAAADEWERAGQQPGQRGQPRASAMVGQTAAHGQSHAAHRPAESAARQRRVAVQRREQAAQRSKQIAANTGPAAPSAPLPRGSGTRRRWCSRSGVGGRSAAAGEGHVQRCRRRRHRSQLASPARVRLPADRAADRVPRQSAGSHLPPAGGCPGLAGRGLASHASAAAARSCSSHHAHAGAAAGVPQAPH